MDLNIINFGLVLTTKPNPNLADFQYIVPTPNTWTANGFYAR